MTTRPSSESDLFAHDAAASATTRTVDDGPYARPASMPPRQAVDAVLIDAIRASVGPFVPAPWRTLASVATVAAPVAVIPMEQRPDTLSDERSDEPSVALPWIDAFLDTGEIQVDGEGQVPIPESAVTPTGEQPSEVPAAVDFSDPALVFAEAVAPEPEPEVVAAVHAEGDAAVAGPVAEWESESVAEEEVAPSTADEWPLDEAGAAMRALADDLTRHDETPDATADAGVAEIAPPVASTPPLPMWGDDDMMDIMPVRASTAAVEREHWAERARRETEHAGSPESAAQLLETVARRVRNGELQLSGISPDMGEAAVLAAALAALLSTRR